MAITTSAGDGVRITSAAVNVTLGSQTQQTGSNTIVFSDIFASLNNGNTSACFPTYVDRLITIRKCTCTEETRYASSEVSGTGTTRIVTVHENWCVVPACGDNAVVSYIIQDAATVTGLGLITKRVQDYSSTRKFRVGNTGCSPTFAYFALLNGASLETVDNSSFTCPDFRVENNGRFANGFTANGAGIGGGYIIGTPAVANELAFEALNGSQLFWYDPLFFTNVNASQIRIAGSSTKGRIKMKNVFGVREFRVGAATPTYSCLNLVGKDTSISILSFNTMPSCSTITFTNMEIDRLRLGYRDTGGNTCNHTINIINFNVKRKTTQSPTIIKGGNTIAVNSSIWNITNPKWNVSSSDFSLDTAGSSIRERFRQNVVVQQADGTALSGVILNNISTSCGTAALRNTVTTSASGIGIIDIESRRWDGTSVTLTSSSAHGLQAHDYAKTSFATIPTVSNKSGGFGQDVTISICADPYVCATEGCAVADSCTKVTIIESSACNNHSLVKWTCGTGTLTSGNTIRQCATSLGTVHIIEGDSIAGTGIIVARTSTNVANCSTLCTSGGWSATYTNSSEKRFYWVYDAGNKGGVDRNAQQVYDHQKAKLHESTLDTADNWDKVKIWGVGQHAHPLKGFSSTKFITVRNSTTNRGWGIIGLVNLGQIEYFTANDGTTFSPAASVSVVVESKDECAVAVASASVGIFLCPVSPGDTALICGFTNGSGILCSSITVGGDTDVIVRIRKKGYIPFQASGTISATSGLTVSATLIRDPAVNLP